MIDKPDPAKDAGRSDAPGQKRPHATLDLKATEVKAPSQAAAVSASTSSAASSGAAAAPGGEAPSPDKPEASAASTASSGKAASSAGSQDATAKSWPPKATVKPDAAAKTEPKPTPGGGASAGSFFSHLAAGVIGGALVYAGAAYLGPKPQPQVQSTLPDQLDARVSALEAAPKQLGDTDQLNAKIGEVESRLAKLDELTQNVAALRDAQGSLQAETKALGEVVQRSDSAAASERIGKLEEQLKMIASGSSSSDGGVPQLAAISGKISDIETSLAAQIAELRKGLPADVHQSIASTQESSEAARAAALRLDRELSGVRTDLARGTQKIDAAKADTDRLQAAVEAAKEETAKLSSSIGELRSFVDSQLKTFAKPQDVAAAVSPVNSKIAEIEQNVRSVVSNEQSRRQNAERIVLSLELSNLKRALDRGQGHGFAAELEEVRRVSAGQLDLGPLERFKDTGVATAAQLKTEFRPLISAVIDADLEPADGSVMDRLLAGAKSVVRVRKVSHDSDDTSTEAIVGRIESALDDGRLGDALAQAKTLPQRARTPIEDWLIKVTARDTVDQAIAAVETKLKASLSGTPDAAAPTAPVPARAAPQN